MNRKSSEAVSSEEDIELIRMEDVEDGLTSKPHSPMAEWDGDDDDDGINSALLGSNARPRGVELSSYSDEKSWVQVKNIVAESAPTLLLTTVGLLFTGEMLDQISHWSAMREVHQLIMIIPVVMNLKGNLEMNLSARLGTAANIGELDDPVVRWSMIIGNLSLLQVQAAVVSFIASCVALLIGLALPRIAPSPSFEVSGVSNSTTRALYEIMDSSLEIRRPIPIRPDHSTFTFSTLVVVSSTAMTAASLSSIVLGSFMCMLIVLCRRFNRDPDNIAPPIASFLGDLVTLCFIGVTSTLLVGVINTPIPFIIGTLTILLAIACLVFTMRNSHVRPLLTQGWSPLFGAMVVSSGTGIVLDRFVSRFEGFALLAVVISGLPGAVGCILASRLSTALHAAALTITPQSMTSFTKPPTRKLVMITLLLVTLPIEIIFVNVVRALGWLKMSITFLALSVVFFFVAVLISLYLARFLTDFLWSKNCDPDMYALPIHSALMDLVGQLLLAVCFGIVLFSTK